MGVQWEELLKECTVLSFLATRVVLRSAATKHGVLGTRSQATLTIVRVNTACEVENYIDQLQLFLFSK